MHYVLAMRSWVYHYPHNEQFRIILTMNSLNSLYYPHNEQFRIRPILTMNIFVLSSQLTVSY